MQRRDLPKVVRLEVGTCLIFRISDPVPLSLPAAAAPALPDVPDSSDVAELVVQVQRRSEEVVPDGHLGENTLQGGAAGFDTGNREKLSDSQAKPPRQAAWLLLIFIPFRC